MPEISWLVVRQLATRAHFKAAAREKFKTFFGRYPDDEDEPGPSDPGKVLEQFAP
jgi:hypothetical protein